MVRKSHLPFGNHYLAFWRPAPLPPRFQFRSWNSIWEYEMGLPAPVIPVFLSCRQSAGFLPVAHSELLYLPCPCTFRIFNICLYMPYYYLGCLMLLPLSGFHIIIVLAPWSLSVYIGESWWLPCWLRPQQDQLASQNLDWHTCPFEEFPLHHRHCTRTPHAQDCPSTHRHCTHHFSFFSRYVLKIPWSYGL